MEEKFMQRFKDAPWITNNPDNKTYILLGGAGGIGSWTALLLTRAGFSPVVYDFDIIEEHNIGGQLYPATLAGMGEKKVDQLAKVIKDFCNEEIHVNGERLDQDSPSSALAISAFDNMEARKIMFQNWCNNYGADEKALFIDGRLTAEQMWIFCIKGGDLEAQKEYLDKHIFPDSDLPDDPCTFRQTSHAAAMIASHIVGFFTNHMANVLSGDNDRVVPFSWEYFIPLNLVTKGEVTTDAAH